jgi:hypothetical protein
MRPARLAIPIALLSFAVAGCGSSKVVVQEVPNGTANVKVSGGSALAPQATATATVTPTPTSTTTGTTTPSTTTTQQSTQSTTQTQPQTTQQQSSTPQASAGGGATAPDANPTPPPGADKQKFEAFCQQNPGAC